MYHKAIVDVFFRLSVSISSDMPKEIPFGYMYLLQAWISPNKVSGTLFISLKLFVVLLSTILNFDYCWYKSRFSKRQPKVMWLLHEMAARAQWLVIPSSLGLQPLWCSKQLGLQRLPSRVKPPTWRPNLRIELCLLCIYHLSFVLYARTLVASVGKTAIEKT